MTLWDLLLETLKDNGKSWNDVHFITSRREYNYYYDEDMPEEYIEKRFNIPIADFVKYSQQVEAIEASLSIVIVGDNFWLQTDARNTELLDYYELPPPADMTVNLAKELLIEDDKDPLIILGLSWKEQD